MSEELLVNVTPQETRVAVVENGVLQEVWIERADKRGLVGNIYKGKVVRVLPGMEAAFINIGLERAAFLHVSDIVNNARENEEGVMEKLTIDQLLHEGQKLLVQVAKDPLGTKGARLTTHLTIPSRYMVLLANENSVGISGKIEGDDEREELKAWVTQQAEENQCGYIVRTAAEHIPIDVLERDIRFLNKLWSAVKERAKVVKPGEIVHEDLPIVRRTLRDIAGDNVEQLRVDSRESYQRAVAFCQQFLPEMVSRIIHYPGERPIFDLYGIEDEIQRALQKRALLKSGGYLIIDQTEAMTTIDVNTGAFVGHRNLEETIFKTNLEAAYAIARQLRLRNLGGIIIIDFIDMVEDEHKRQVMRALEKALSKDNAKTQVCSVSSLGLIEMTRKRIRESLSQVLCEDCPTCDGRGSVKSAETVCFEISREIIRQVRQFDVSSLTVLAADIVIDMLLNEQSANFAELEAFIGVPIRLQSEPLYTQEQYDVVMV